MRCKPSVLEHLIFDLNQQKKPYAPVPACRISIKKTTSRVWQSKQNKNLRWTEQESSAKSDKQPTTSITEGSSPHHNTALCGRQDKSTPKSTRQNRWRQAEVEFPFCSVQIDKRGFYWMIWFTVTAAANVEPTDCNLMCICHSDHSVFSVYDFTVTKSRSFFKCTSGGVFLLVWWQLSHYGNQIQ